ncbi:MAG: lysine biosynthesis protein LysX [Thaumarchaeota archaeon]|nr:lysine biosynthesis protein LysX [Nitrososphaerota archaeon]
MTNSITVLYDTIRWEEKALAKTCEKNNVKIKMVNCKKLMLDLNKKIENSIFLQRCVSYYRNLHSTAALEGAGANVINCLHTAIYAGNKLFTHMLLKKYGVKTPFASIAFSKESAMEILEKYGCPQIIKPTIGSWGRMISKINDKVAGEQIIENRETMSPIYQIHYMEEFVKRPPRDIRAIMVGDAIVAAIYRYSGNTNWKTNMALGGKAEECKITNEMEKLCFKARDAVHGQILGIDLMESQERGLLVHEINNTTEYKNTVKVCNVDIPTMIINYIKSLK